MSQFSEHPASLKWRTVLEIKIEALRMCVLMCYLVLVMVSWAHTYIEPIKLHEAYYMLIQYLTKAILQKRGNKGNNVV